jgi:hypothetical protein
VIPLPWRIGILAGSVAGLIGLGWQVNRWRTEAALVKEMAGSLKQARQEVEDVKAEKRAGSVRRYQLEIGRGADLGPAPVVRLCQPAITIAADPAPGVADAGTAAQPLQPVLPRDIGGDLDALMREADRVSAQLRAVLEVAGPEPLF